MRAFDYLDFDLLVELTGPSGAYRGRVLDAPTGQTAPTRFTMPFSDLSGGGEFPAQDRPRRRTAVRGLDALAQHGVTEFGAQLFERVFHDKCGSRWRPVSTKPRAAMPGFGCGCGSPTVPELADLPWEYLYDRHARFLALSEWTPLVRYLELPGRVRPFAVTPRCGFSS